MELRFFTNQQLKDSCQSCRPLSGLPQTFLLQLWQAHRSTHVRRPMCLKSSNQSFPRRAPERQSSPRAQAHCPRFYGQAFRAQRQGRAWHPGRVKASGGPAWALGMSGTGTFPGQKFSAMASFLYVLLLGAWHSTLCDTLLHFLLHPKSSPVFPAPTEFYLPSDLPGHSD